MWSFGAMSGLFISVQLLSGILLSAHYTPHADYAFSSVQHIVRDVQHGWLLQGAHKNGATFLFLALYSHVGRGLCYESHEFPRDLVWNSGLILFVLSMGVTFCGYVLP
jgi:quinol-cytochrome oxidoreductase complex cytochrome b subunit